MQCIEMPLLTLKQLVIITFMPLTNHDRIYACKMLLIVFGDMEIAYEGKHSLSAMRHLRFTVERYVLWKFKPISEMHCTCACLGHVSILLGSRDDIILCMIIRLLCTLAMQSPQLWQFHDTTQLSFHPTAEEH